MLATRPGTARRARPRSRTATAPCRRRRRCACAPTTTRSPSPPAAQALVEQLLHRREVVGGRRALRRALAHDDAADRRVTDEEAGVGRERAVDPVEVLAEATSSPTARPPRARTTDMPSTRASIRMQVVAVLGAERRDREAAVAADHGRHAVQRRRGQRRVPEHLRVVVRVDVDEARARRPCRRRRSCASRARRRRRSRRCARRGSRRRRAAPGAPVPSTIEPSRMIRSSIASPSGSCRTQLLSTRCAGRTCGPSRPRHRCAAAASVPRSRAASAPKGAGVAIVARSLEPGSGGHLAGSLRETADAIDGGRRHRAARSSPISPIRRATAPRSSPRPNAALGPVDILVNNAAACFYLSIDETSERRLRVAYEVNVITPYLLTKAVVPGMRERGAGWIVNITSAIVDPGQRRRSRRARRRTRRARPRSTG